MSRYEFQWATIHTGPDPLSGLPDVESSTMQSHLISQDITWTPWSRLSLQAGLNYVLSDTSKIAKIEQEPRFEGRQVVMVLAPR